MGITSIRQIVNQTGLFTSFRKLENLEDSGRIGPGEINHNEIWITWCDTAPQLVSKALIIDIYGDVLVYIWQSGNTVYTSQQLYKDFSIPEKPLYIPQPKPLPPYPYIPPYPAIRPGVFEKGKPIGGIAMVDGNRRLLIQRVAGKTIDHTFRVQLEML